MVQKKTKKGSQIQGGVEKGSKQREVPSSKGFTNSKKTQKGLKKVEFQGGVEKGSQREVPSLKDFDNSLINTPPLKKVQKGSKKGSKLGGYSSLTNTEKEVLLLLTEDFMTPLKVAKYRHTSPKAVYKIIKKLEKKGVFNYKNKGFKILDIPPHQEIKQKNHRIRLHGQQFCIKIIEKYKKYSEFLVQNKLTIDNNVITLHKNSINVYSQTSFFSDDSNKAHSKSKIYWHNFFHKLEIKLDILILKKNNNNIKEVQSHYAEIDNELAKDYNSKGEKLRVYGTKDNKMWLETDDSFNFNETETTHPETSKVDMQNVVAPYFNDLRDKEYFLPSEVKELILIGRKEHIEQEQQHLKLQKIVYELGSSLSVLIKPKEQDNQESEEEPDLNYFG